MNDRGISKIERLINKGVKIPNPESVEIGDDVNIERISGKGVVIYSGCKIYGGNTLILKGSKLGYETPVTIEGCHIGPGVDLKGGFLKKAVCLENVSVGSGAHVRAGTILEEKASVAHTVGLKQTILFPFVTLGSLINFCDCFMSGGTSVKDHSEIGSSFIHFNYTPNQDKATPSLMGDVPNGVMLNQKPIFLGGQGGLVGPCRLAFGTVSSAGTIYRKDEPRPGRLIIGRGLRGGNILFTSGMYRSIKRIVINNIIYIANLMALLKWYIHIRSQFISDIFPDTLLDGLKEKLNMAIEERIKRLKALKQKMPESAEIYRKLTKEKASSLLLKQKNEFFSKWDEVEASFKDLQISEINTDSRDAFLEKIHIGINEYGKEYISVIKRLKNKDAQKGTAWLQEIVDYITDETLRIIPSFAN